MSITDCMEYVGVKTIHDLKVRDRTVFPKAKTTTEGETTWEWLQLADGRIIELSTTYPKHRAWKMALATFAVN